MYSKSRYSTGVRGRRIYDRDHSGILAQLSLSRTATASPGLAITLWLLVVSIATRLLPVDSARGGARLEEETGSAASRVALHATSFAARRFTCSCCCCYTGLYSLEVIRNHELPNAFFRDGMQLHAARVHAEHLRVHHRDFRRRDQAPRPTAKSKRRARTACRSFTLYRRVILPSALRQRAALLQQRSRS